MQLRMLLNISVGLSMIALAACTPQNTYIGRKFGGETTFVHKDIVSSTPTAIATPEEIASALKLKDIEKYDTAESKKDLEQLVLDSKDEDFFLTDTELNDLENAPAANTDGFITIDNGKKIFPRIKPLIKGVLYKLEIAREGSLVSIPGIIFRKQIEVSSVDTNETNAKLAQTVLNKLKKKNLSIRSLRLYGRPDVQQLTTVADSDNSIDFGLLTTKFNGEVLAEADLSNIRPGLTVWDAPARGTLRNQGIAKALNANPERLVEGLLLNQSFTLTLMADAVLVGDYKLNPSGKLFNEEFILDLEKELKKL